MALWTLNCIRILSAPEVWFKKPVKLFYCVSAVVGLNVSALLVPRLPWSGPKAFRAAPQRKHVRPS
jgi:hypothetical protein